MVVKAGRTGLINMPMYEYVCKSCGDSFEEIVPMSERDAMPVCPKCNSSEGVKRAVSATNFRLAGTGWASDGYSSTSMNRKTKPGQALSHAVDDAKDSLSETKEELNKKRLGK